MAAGRFDAAGGQEPRGVPGELISGNWERVDAVVSAECLESLVLGEQGFLGRGGPGAHH